MKYKKKKVSKTKKIKNNSILDMSQKCLLNHCLPEYSEYQEQIPNGFKMSVKSLKTKKQTKKFRQIIKSFEKCSKKYCSK